MMSETWQKIKPFATPAQHRAVREFLDREVREGRAEYIPVLERFNNATFDERWVRRLDDGEVWRIVDPDYPFQGAFEPVHEAF